MLGYYILILTYLFCLVHSQLVLSGPGITSRDLNGFEACGPLTSSITVIDNSMSLALANVLRSMILDNFLDSSINLTPKSYQNSEFASPCSFVIESVTYSPVIDTFYPDYPIYDIYPPVSTDIPNFYITDPIAPRIFYTETITSFGPSSLPPLTSSSDVILSDLFAPSLQGYPVSCINGPMDSAPINLIPSNSIGLIDLIMPPPVFEGFNEFYMSGAPCYFDGL